MIVIASMSHTVSILNPWASNSTNPNDSMFPKFIVKETRTNSNSLKTKMDTKLTAEQQEMWDKLSARPIYQHYLDSLEANKVTNGFAREMVKIADKIVARPQIANCTFREDIKSSMVVEMARTWPNIKASSSADVVAYLAALAFNSATRYIQGEHTQNIVKEYMADSLLE